MKVEASRTGVVQVVVLCLAGCAHGPVLVPAAHDVEAEVRRLMALEDVTGLALAIIDQAEVRQVATFGLRNVEQQLPLEIDTVMYGASLTKSAFAYFVLQLVDEGRLSLETPLEQLLPQPLPSYEAYADLVDDPRWKLLTPRMVLNHATGFANFRWLEDDKKLRFHFEPGQRYAYSGEAMNLLQMVIEVHLGLDLGPALQKQLFDRVGLTRTSLTWRDDFAANFAETYGDAGQLVAHSRRSRARAAGSMDTTIADQAKLWAAVLRGDLLSAAARAELIRPRVKIASARQFPTFRDATDPRGPALQFASATGVLTFVGAQGTTWFKGGHDDGTANLVVCIEQSRRCVVVLSNSVRAERIYPRLVRFILGDTSMPWWWEYGRDG